MFDKTTYTVIGMCLTLTSLLGTYFYVHLSNWLRDMLKLKAKWDINKKGSDVDQIKAQWECKIEIKGLFNHIPIMISLIISAFIWFVCVRSLVLLAAAPTESLAQLLSMIIIIFLVLYTLLTMYFLIHGMIIGFKMKKQMA
jgi:hypothetical protein